MKKRYAIIDEIRGLIIVSMIIYHGIWSMVYIFGEEWSWYQSVAAYWWQQSICWGFILLSGFCWSMGKHKWRRGILVFAAGILVSVVTRLVMPENAITFGVLTCLGSCMLLMIPLQKLMFFLKPIPGALLSFGLFILLRNVNRGGLGFEDWKLMELPESLYADLATAYLGFPPESFYSVDYFPVLPWLFLFLTGYFIYRMLEEKNCFAAFEKKESGLIQIPLNWLGRHSLFIYLIHQPIIYGGLYLWYTVSI